MTRVYKSLQNDFLYPDINNVLIFAENHDTNRINDHYPDLKTYKRMMSVLLTLRGIPQIYYGSEIDDRKESQGDGAIRRISLGGGQRIVKMPSMLHQEQQHKRPILILPKSCCTGESTNRSFTLENTALCSSK